MEVKERKEDGVRRGDKNEQWKTKERKGDNAGRRDGNEE
jgi:hypothetical protein